jgi:two-component system, NarL family, nitrate/nitrite response regulator NarL
MNGAAANRLFIVEDHAIFAETLALALASTTLSVEVITDSHAELLTHELLTKNSVVLMDLELGTEGLSLNLTGSLAGMGIRVILLTGSSDQVLISRTVLAGAAGCLSKALNFDDIKASIGRVIDGEILMTARDLAEHREVVALANASALRRKRFDQLTQRESVVLWHLVDGLSVDEITRVDHVSKTTVRAQVRAILSKLDVHTQLSAVAAVRETGWSGPASAA